MIVFRGEFPVVKRLVILLPRVVCVWCGDRYYLRSILLEGYIFFPPGSLLYRIGGFILTLIINIVDGLIVPLHILEAR